MQKLASPKKAGSPGLLRCNQFTITVETIFEDSHIPISKWLLAIHLLYASKKGMSAHQFHGCSASRTSQRGHGPPAPLRHVTGAIGVKAGRAIIEADETYIGGRVRTGPIRKGARMENKIGEWWPSSGAAGLCGPWLMPMITAEKVKDAIVQNVEQSSMLMTDESHLYVTNGREMGGHESVKHSLKEYVGRVPHEHGRGLLLAVKRGIFGVYHHIGKGHVGRYVDEFVFRYDTRKLTDLRVELAVLGAEGKRLTCKQPAGMGEE